MQTEKIIVTSTGEGLDEALDATTRFADEEMMDPRSALRFRLLAEETLGMVQAITSGFKGVFWIDENDDDEYLMHLTAKTVMDYEKKKELIDASTEKKNLAAKGFMGKIREMIENGIHSIDEAGTLQTDYEGSPVMYGSMGLCDVDSSTAYMWSLNQYRDTMKDQIDSDSGVRRAWDELEKSIVANIADDVRVSVTGDKVEMVIMKKADR